MTKICRFDIKALLEAAMLETPLQKALREVQLPGEKFSYFQDYIICSSLGRMWRFKKFGLGNKPPHLRALIGALVGQQKKYKQIRDDYGKLRYRHDVIWMAFHDCEEIPDGFDVHHVNGKVDDNSVNNLQLVERSEHHRIHAARARALQPA